MSWKRWSVHLSHINATYELAGRGQNGLFQLCFSAMQRNFAPCFEHSVEESAGSRLCALGPSVNLDSCPSPRTTLPLLLREEMEVEEHPAALFT